MPAHADDGFADEEGSDMELKPPSDFAEDMLDIVEEELVDPPYEVEQIDDAAVDSAVMDDINALVESALAGGSVDDVAALGPRMEDGVASARIDARGYVTSDLEPWSSKLHVGRITVWPTEAPPNKQNVAARCYMHTGCSHTRRRQNVSDGSILRWLFLSTPLTAHASSEEHAAAQAAHARLASEILQTEVTAAHSGAASSSWL
jgi:hypothetical protein